MYQQGANWYRQIIGMWRNIQHPSRFTCVKREYRAVWHWPVAWRRESEFCLFAKNLHLGPAMERRHEEAIADRDSNDNRRVGAQTIRLGKRSCDDCPKIFQT